MGDVRSLVNTHTWARACAPPHTHTQPLSWPKTPGAAVATVSAVTKSSQPPCSIRHDGTPVHHTRILCSHIMHNMQHGCLSVCLLTHPDPFIPIQPQL